jgi:hypothetical protein
LIVMLPCFCTRLSPSSEDDSNQSPGTVSPSTIAADAFEKCGRGKLRCMWLGYSLRTIKCTWYNCALAMRLMQTHQAAMVANRVSAFKYQEVIPNAAAVIASETPRRYSYLLFHSRRLLRAPYASTKILADSHPIPRALLLAGKNALGFVLVLTGIFMLLLPGQGLLTIIAGMMLLDFPGKQLLERRLVRRPLVLRSINWLRKT